MQDTRSTTRESLEDFVSAWLDGDEGALAGTCSADVRWWTPVDDETGTGPARVRAALDRVLATVHRPIEVTALAVSEDGSCGVVELRAAATPGAAAALVTSVVTVVGGKVVQGRTYADVEASPRPSGPGS